MNGKFDMKLVIDAVTTPLLHARLSEASSYRERAAILRSLAEAALRESAGSIGKATYPAASSAAVSSRDGIPAEPQRQRDTRPSVETDTALSSDSVPPLVPDESGEAQAYDVQGIAEAFGAFG
jgi:Tfp pilus assembly protein PilX